MFAKKDLVSFIKEDVFKYYNMVKVTIFNKCDLRAMNYSLNFHTQKLFCLYLFFQNIKYNFHY